MKKASLFRFYVWYAITVALTNFVHPVTPALVHSLGLPDYMFGLLFSFMSTALFLFSPMWGKIGDMIGRPKSNAISIFGYMIGQTLFCFGGNGPMMLFARVISGAFMGGYSVNSMAYIIDSTDETDRGKNMTIMAAIMTVMTAFGYLIGGVVGNNNIRLPFYLQIVTLFLSSISSLFLLHDAPNFQKADKIPLNRIAKEANPLVSFLEAKKVMNFALAMFFATVFFAFAGTTGFDNSFNYYLKAQLDFPPAYNGYIKAGVGIVGLIANTTLNTWIAKKFNLRKAVSVVFTCAGVSILAVYFSKDLIPFLVCSILYYIFNAVYLPILQTLTSKDSSISNGLISGMFNSSRSFGMIIGSLLASFMYEINPSLPFLICGLFFLIAGVIALINSRQYKKIEDEEARQKTISEA